MYRLNEVVHHWIYQDYYGRIKRLEKERIFCCHQMTHFLDVARIAYIKNLEENLGFEKDVIYTAAVLHDIGKSFQYKWTIPHEVAGEKIAKEILTTLPEDAQFTEEEQQQILRAIRGHRRKHEGAADRTDCRRIDGVYAAEGSSRYGGSRAYVYDNARNQETGKPDSYIGTERCV